MTSSGVVRCVTMASRGVLLRLASFSQPGQEVAAMPLLDHFHPPLSEERHWDGFHSKWANTLVDALNEDLPAGYFAEPHVHTGARVEIDAATFAEGHAPDAGRTATLPLRV